MFQKISVIYILITKNCYYYLGCLYLTVKCCIKNINIIRNMVCLHSLTWYPLSSQDMINVNKKVEISNPHGQPYLLDDCWILNIDKLNSNPQAHNIQEQHDEQKCGSCSNTDCILNHHFFFIDDLKLCNNLEDHSGITWYYLLCARCSGTRKLLVV